MVETHYCGSWLRGFSISSSGAASGDQVAHNSKATDNNDNSTDPSCDAKTNTLKDKLETPLGS